MGVRDGSLNPGLRPVTWQADSKHPSFEVRLIENHFRQQLGGTVPSTCQNNETVIDKETVATPVILLVTGHEAPPP